MEKLIEFAYKSKEYAIKRPTQEELMEIDMEYRKGFSVAVRNNIMTEFESKKRFEKDDVWGEKNEDEMRKLQLEIVNMELELEKKEGVDGRQIAFDLMDKRNKLIELLQYKTHLFKGQTAEGYASERKTLMFAALCAVEKSGKRVFKSLQDFLDHEDHEFTANCYGQASLADYGMNEEDLNPIHIENKWLKEQGYIKDNGQLSEKYYQETLTEGGIIFEDKKLKAKKTTKKKTKKRTNKKTSKK